MSICQTAAVIGTGAIGSSWAALFLAHDLVVRAHDPAEGSEERLLHAIQAAWPTIVALGGPGQPPWHHLEWSDDIRTAVTGADFVQESGPERRDVKQALINEADRHAPALTVIASSSSGFAPSVIAEGAERHPERVLVGHPFHPAYLIPLVEVVPGQRTSDESVARAVALYREVGKKPIRVRTELQGHLVNRLQAALWREAYDLVARGAASVADIDSAITNGPGLRWSVVGPFAGQHLSGDAGGLAHTLEHLGPPMVEWWRDLRTPALTSALMDQLIGQMAQEMGATSSEELSAARDEQVLRLIIAKSSDARLTT